MLAIHSPNTLICSNDTYHTYMSIADTTSPSLICGDYLRNVCTRGTKCRFLHTSNGTESEDHSRPEKRLRRNADGNSSKNDAGNVGVERQEHKDNMAKEKMAGTASMQLKVEH